MNHSQQPLGVAIHGAGEVAYAHAASWQRNPRVRIVSVSSRRRASAQALVDKLELDCAVTDRYEDVLSNRDVHIVNVSGPNHVHATQAIAAAESGRHVLVEKPTVLSMDDNRALSAAVAKAGVRSIVSFVLRWNPMFQSLKTLLAKNTIGDLFYAEVDYWHGIHPTYRGWTWAAKRATGGSATLMGGCHAVDALRWFVGDEASEVWAISNNRRAAFEYDANVLAMIRFKSGLIAKTSVLFDACMPYTFNVDLVGTEGTTRNNRLWAPTLLAAQTDWMEFPTITPDSADVHHHPFDAQINHFVECICEERESHCNVADAYRTHEICLAIDQSAAAGGQVVTLPL